jgi:hypothetical protein
MTLPPEARSPLPPPPPPYPIDPYAPPAPVPPYATAAPGYVFRPNSGLAVTSLVLGIIAVAMFGLCGILSLPFGVAALAVGFTARARIRQSMGALDGAGIALAGIITGGIASGLAVLGLLVVATIVIIGIASGGFGD